MRDKCLNLKFITDKIRCLFHVIVIKGILLEVVLVLVLIVIYSLLIVFRLRSW
jgi:hypothetical protein